MNSLDYVVLLGTILGIAIYGSWRTRGQRNLSSYLKGNQTAGWAVIGISVMATQASAVTFISATGQGYEYGLDFVQNYFGLPLAMVLIAAVFVPIYRRLHVYTAYEYLGRRFDAKTRLLGAGLFLLQRGFAAGITIYAPAIVLSTLLGWRLDLTIILTGLLVTVYTAMGGSEAVSVTQQYQMTVIFCGMAGAFVVLLLEMPAQLSVPDVLTVAGGFQKLEAVSFSTDPNRRYTFWSGLLGGFFLALSYFGTDQSQVQRYLSGASVRESRLGLMFNGVLKIPMQFFILFVGVMVFVFYQFSPSPIFFNQTAWKTAAAMESGQDMQALEQEFAEVHAEKRQLIERWLEAKHSGSAEAAGQARQLALDANKRSLEIRKNAKKALAAANPRAPTNDADYVFITFVLDHLPHGMIGLLVAAILAAALQSKAAELNALASSTMIDFYRHLVHVDATDAHYVIVSKCFTIFWGLVAISFALFANLTENLIQAANILGSIFYGVMLGLFLVAFFLRWISGTAVFSAALVAQGLVFLLYFSDKIGRLLLSAGLIDSEVYSFIVENISGISYLWYNLIGCAACILFSLVFQVGLHPTVERSDP
jgi:solute:Na+ symporter, SSS family